MTDARNRSLFLWLTLTLLLPIALFAGEEVAPADTKRPERLTLVDAAMCEKIEDGRLSNRAVVFSTTLGNVTCYTAFDPVPEKTDIYHEWYRKDSLASRMKLTLQPPRWSSVSTIQLREADKGPWRVEIVDGRGNIFKTLRFSITD